MPADLRSGLVAGVALLALTGCWSSAGEEGSGAAPAPDPAGSRTATDHAVTDYVALGDSYTSAPYVPSTDLAGGCFRSDGNYPSILESRLEPSRFVDVSCSAADTDDLAGSQRTVGGQGQVPPQLRALRRSTDLVTLGIGANDEGLFARLIACVQGTDATACAAALASSTAVLGRTEQRVTRALGRVRALAPDARVVLVGYPRLVDPATPCDLIPAPDARLDDLAAVEARLNRSLRSAARSASVEYVDMRRASVGHEVCSAYPWVQGQETDQDRALAYHPFAAEQEAVAQRVVEILREEGRS